MPASTAVSVSGFQGATATQMQMISRGEYKYSQRCAPRRAPSLAMVNVKHPLTPELPMARRALAKATQRQATWGMRLACQALVKVGREFLDRMIRSGSPRRSLAQAYNLY